MSKNFKNKIVYILIFISMILAVGTGVNAVEEKSLQWMDHSTYLDVESDIGWTHPELYVGITARLDTLSYPTFTLASIVDGKIVESGEFSALGEETSRSNAAEVRVNIVDYFVDTTKNNLWYKIEAAEGYTLPETFADNPYILYLTNYSVDGFCRPATMHMLPKKAMARNDELIINNNTAAASVHIILSKEQMPSFFDVEYVYVYDSGVNWYGYEIEDISKWDESFSNEYKYVAEDDVVLIPAAVSACYDKLLNAEGTDEYNDILATIPEDILDMFSPVHKENTDKQYEELIRLENIEYKTTTTINGIEVPVSVKGKIPETGVKLSVTPVDNDTVVSEGFKFRNMSDIVAALDIKILNVGDDSEWQPEEGNHIYVSIGMEALGYDDGRIFELQHKHGERIDFYEIFIVMDGKLTIGVDGFSIFTVSEPLGTANADKIGNNGTNISLVVGETKVYYFTTGTSDRVDRNAPGRPSKWAVTDPEGAIYYTVHASDSPRNNGTTAPWIKVTALKPTCESMSATGNPVNDDPVILTAQWNNNNSVESKLTITPPKAEVGVDNGKKLYIKDIVNTTGKITAALVDTNGREIPNGLDGAAYTWSRSDDMFITPRAYADDYKSVNIAIDHAGLVEDRKDGPNYKLVTYTLKATLADGNILTATYTVYYQSEILNAGFENVLGTNSNYTFFVNGMPNLYWKTTAPGPGPSGNLTRDIEIANFNGGNCSMEFGVDGASQGIQFAELNAEAFGALYQDIITAPGEDIDWAFAHAPRDINWDNTHDVNNAMFIVIGATEEAQKLTEPDDMKDLGDAAQAKAATLDKTERDLFDSGKLGIDVTFNGATYKVWFHDAGRADDKNTKYVWTDLEGSYHVPNNQFRTRLFFISEPNPSGDNANGGNLIDKASAGQYKDILIEYYEESYNDKQEITLEHLDEYDQIGKALVYSPYPIEYLDDLENGSRHDYLHRILINGSNYPYDLRYAGSPSIYVENYPEDESKPLVDPVAGGEDYDKYDIVVQIYVRDTVIAMQKKLEFPTTDALDEHGNVIKDDKGNVVKKELLTIEQKLTLMDSLENGYQTSFTVYTDENGNYKPNKVTLSIKNPDPKGNYSGHITPDNNPILGYTYRVKEADMTDLPGLKLSKVLFKVTGYRYGQSNNFEQSAYYELELSTQEQLQNLVSPPITINDKLEGPGAGYKVADVEVVNTYVEKQTVIEYKAVGNGKVAFIGVGGSDLDYVDTPTETLAYYSGKAKGAAVHPGSGASFVGWYKDEACTEEVKDIDGVWDKTTNTFKPNANILNAEKVTFYAKFVSGVITINRTNANPGQVFVYHVTGTDGLDIYVSVKCDEHGNGSTQIHEIIDSDYTVTEVTDFSWRYPDPLNSGNDVIEKTITKTSPDSKPGDPIEFIFDFNGGREHIYWVNGYSDSKKNFYKKITGGGS